MKTTSYTESEPPLARVLGKRALVYLGILVLALTLMLAFNTGNASAAGPTYVYEDITSDTTWTEADSPYIVNASIAIDPGYTLTIEPNVTVMFDAGTDLLVGGAIDAQGTPDRPITFTANGSTTWGFWDGIDLNETSTGSVMDNVIVEYADDGIVVVNSDLQLSNADLRYLDDNGVEFLSSKTTMPVTMSDVNASNLDGMGLWFWNVEGSVDANIDGFTSWNTYYPVAVESNHTASLTIVDMELYNTLYNSVYAVSYNGDVEVTLTDVIISGSNYEGIFAEAWNGAVDIDVTNMEMEDTGGGIYAEGYEDVAVTVDPTQFSDIDDIGIYAYSYEGSVDVSLYDVEMNNIMDYGIYAASDAEDVTFDIDGLLMDDIGYSAIYSTAQGSIDAVFNDVAINDTIDWAFYLYAFTGGMTVDADMIELTNIYWDGFRCYANHSIEFNINDFDMGVYGDGDGVYLNSFNGDVDITASNGYMEFLIGDAFDVYCPNGAITETFHDIMVDEACRYFYRSYEPMATDFSLTLTNIAFNDTDYGVIPAVDLEGNITLILEGCDFTNIDDGFDMTSTNGTVTLTVSDCMFGNFDDDLFDVESTNYTIVYSFVDVVVDGLDGYFTLFDMPEPAMLEILIDNLEINDTDGVMPAVVMAGDIDLIINNSVLSNIYGDLFQLTSTNGSIMIDVTDSHISNVWGSAIWAWAPNGDVDAIIDPSVIEGCDDYGIYMDSADDVSFVMEDSSINECGIGAAIYGDLGVDVVLDNATFDGNFDYGLYVYADLGNVTLAMTDGLVNDTYWDTGIYMESYDGEVRADFSQASFGFNYYSIMALTWQYDVEMSVDGCTFTGDYSDSVMVESANDSELMFTNNVMNGYEANANGWYFFEEIDYEYEIIDPESWTTGSSLSVTLPFEFPYTGGTYTSAVMYEDGYINVGGYDVIPCEEDFIANMYPYYGYKTFDDRVVFQWDVYADGEDQYLRNVFEVVFYENGDIQFNYAEMESVSHTANPYGLQVGMNFIDVGEIWKNSDPFDNDWTSYYFTYAPMSDGYAVMAESYNNNTAWVYNNTISNYYEGGVLCMAEEGWAWMDAVDNSFSNMVSMEFGALMSMAMNNTIWGNAQDNDLSSIAGYGMAFVSSPSDGGVDEMVMVNNTFTDVGYLTMACVNEIEDEYNDDPISYTSTTTITDNVGVNSGMIWAITEIYSENST
jgi:hypothetical protein